MYCLISFFLPSMLGLKILDKLSKINTKKDFVIYYSLLVLFSNFICSIFIIILNKFDGNLCLYIDEHLMFTCKYILMSLIVNLILSFIMGICIKNCDISLEVKHEKNNKKRN